MHVVRWKREARDELTSIWLEANSEDRKRITQSCHFIESNLAYAPNDFGESRDGDRRVGFDPPLGVLYQVVESGQRVRVVSVWRIE